MNEKEKKKEKKCCAPMKIKIGDSETAGHVCLDEMGNVSVNVVSKEELKKATKKAVEEEK